MRLFVFGGVVLALWCAGCSECDGNEARCDDNVARNCESGDLSYVWLESDCHERTCQIAPEGETPQAFCALSSDVDPLCPAELRSERSASRCLDGQVVAWSYGFRVAETPCTHCVDVTTPGFDASCGAALCSLLPDVDPLCPDGMMSTECDGQTLVECRCGYRVEEQPASQSCN